MKTYDRDIYRHLTETTEENERLKTTVKTLRSENAALKAEVGYLRKKIGDIETILEDRINNAVNAAVERAVTPLHIEIEKKDKEITRLKAIINKDSSNSSKPPSMNGFKKIPNNREKSKKNRGGQPGHKGTTLTIPKNLDELVKEHPKKQRLM